MLIPIIRRHIRLGLLSAAFIIPAALAHASDEAAAAPADGGGGAAAKTSVSNTAATNVVSVSVPESPAFTVLGLSPQKVTRPQTPAALATSLLNGVDQNGNLQTGLAVDFTPFLLLFGDTYTIDKYQAAGAAEQALVNTSLSIGAVKGATDTDKSAKVSLGFRTTLFDRGDPRGKAATQAFDDCMTKETGKNAGKKPGGGGQPLAPATPDELAKIEQDGKQELDSNGGPTAAVWDTCKKRSNEANWNKTAWDIGGAISLNSPTGATADFASSTKAIYTSLGLGLGSNPDSFLGKSYLIVHLEYLAHQLIPDPKTKGAFIVQDSPGVSAKYMYGIKPNLNFSISGSATRNIPVGQPAKTSYQLAVGTEFKLSSGLWLQFAAGGASKTNATGGQAFVLSALKFSFYDSAGSVPPVDMTRP